MQKKTEGGSRLTQEQNRLRPGVTNPEASGSDSITRTDNPGGAGLRTKEMIQSIDGEPSPRLAWQLGPEGTQSIDVSKLFYKDVTESGSFDIRGDIWASTFGKVLQAVPIPSLLVDEYFEIVMVNQGCTLLNSGCDGLQGNPFVNLFPNPSEAQKIETILHEVFLTRKPRSVHSHLRIGRAQIWARLSLRSIRIRDIRLLLVLVEDLTHERKLLVLSRNYQRDLRERVKERTVELEKINRRLQIEVAERQRAEEMLVQTERLRAMGEMSEGVAHNLRNLLQMLMFLTHSVGDYVSNEDTSAALEKLERMADALGHTVETVNRLRDFAQLTRSRTDVADEIFDFTSTLQKAIELTKVFWHTTPQKRGYTVELRASLFQGCLIKGNESQILEVLVNLIKNAAEAIPGGGEINLKSDVRAEKVIFAIRDTGVGISQENIAKLFTPFFTTKEQTGTGLGLATSRGIVHRHGGKIVVHSKEGEGTTFTVTFPLAATEPCPKPTLSPTRGQPQLRILLVDDSDSNLLVLKASLEEHQHRVWAVTSGHDALKTFSDDHLDLVLCDLVMPGMNGWEVGRRIKKLCADNEIPKPHFILLTGWGRQSCEDAKMIESGVDTVVEKPVALDQLLHIINQIIPSRDTH